MSRLEFRAWDEKRKKYLHHISRISFDMGKNIYKVEGYHKEDVNFSNLITLIKPIIEQYTGLRDKNDTKIFQGDILKHDYANSLYWEITFNDFAFCVKNTNRCVGTPIYDLLQFSESEIIGNIHENPELLERSK